jgi:hypothetical protein
MTLYPRRYNSSNCIHVPGRIQIVIAGPPDENILQSMKHRQEM